MDELARIAGLTPEDAKVLESLKDGPPSPPLVPLPGPPPATMGEFLRRVLEQSANRHPES